MVYYSKSNFETIFRNPISEYSPLRVLIMTKVKYSIRAVERVLNILKSFSVDHPERGYLEVAEETDIPSSTVFKLMNILAQEGFLEESASGRYCIGREAFRLGNLYLSNKSLVDIVNPWLQELAQRLGFTSSLGILEQGSSVTILTRLGTSPLSLSRDRLVGERSPLHLSALGKALVMDLGADELRQLLPPSPWPQVTPNSITNVDQLVENLSEARESGCTRDEEETSIGMRCVGCPIRDHRGRIAAAISVSATTIEVTDDSLPRIMETVKEIATNISVDLGYQPERPA
jgi:IclR family KDG regulon transcriptional repressor